MTRLLMHRRRVWGGPGTPHPKPGRDGEVHLQGASRSELKLGLALQVEGSCVLELRQFFLSLGLVLVTEKCSLKLSLLFCRYGGS